MMAAQGRDHARRNPQRANDSGPTTEVSAHSAGYEEVPCVWPFNATEKLGPDIRELLSMHCSWCVLDCDEAHGADLSRRPRRGSGELRHRRQDDLGIQRSARQENSSRRSRPASRPNGTTRIVASTSCCRTPLADLSASKSQ